MIDALLSVVGLAVIILLNLSSPEVNLLIAEGEKSDDAAAERVEGGEEEEGLRGGESVEEVEEREDALADDAAAPFFTFTLTHSSSPVAAMVWLGGGDAPPLPVLEMLSSFDALADVSGFEAACACICFFFFALVLGDTFGDEFFRTAVDDGTARLEVAVVFEFVVAAITGFFAAFAAASCRDSI